MTTFLDGAGGSDGQLRGRLEWRKHTTAAEPPAYCRPASQDVWRQKRARARRPTDRPREQHEAGGTVTGRQGVRLVSAP